MFALLQLVGEYGPVAAAMFPALVPALDSVVAAVEGKPFTVPAFRVSYKGKHIEIGPIPVSLVS